MTNDHAEASSKWLPFDLAWVDKTVENFEANQAFKYVDEEMGDRKVRIAPILMEDAADMTIAEIEVAPKTPGLRIILAEAGKICVSNYEQEMNRREKVAIRLNWFADQPDVDQQG